MRKRYVACHNFPIPPILPLFREEQKPLAKNIKRLFMRLFFIAPKLAPDLDPQPWYMCNCYKNLIIEIWGDSFAEISTDS